MTSEGPPLAGSCASVDCGAAGCGTLIISQLHSRSVLWHGPGPDRRLTPRRAPRKAAAGGREVKAEERTRQPGGRPIE
ncbi:MAG: hypothetical protein BJ554DRAFT_7738 [Olpidium bornovanus]|uniref:Uncharacterized protein n=1 Tax=Olpidium bornovanus TaxID=278681 RepID=A0A8H8DJ84_9FUNG|nr:MAG: hypothetical protein BJ554DRAFT_7738 [Olpidium bornovanus]